MAGMMEKYMTFTYKTSHIVNVREMLKACISIARSLCTRARVAELLLVQSPGSPVSDCVLDEDNSDLPKSNERRWMNLRETSDRPPRVAIVEAV